MATATLDRPLAMEEVSDFLPLAIGESRVDAENHVIRGVRVLGLVSRNHGRVLGLTEEQFGAAVDRPYTYSMEAVRRAIPLYENATVYSDHSKFELNEEGQRVFKQFVRENEEMLGWLKNVRAVEGKGLFADLHYLEANPMAGVLVEVARRNPSKLALSHEAAFHAPQLIGGRITITEITAVQGIALVNSQPGTTNGLFESHTEVPQMEPEVITDLDGASPAESPSESPVSDAGKDLKSSLAALVMQKLDSATPEQLKAVLDALSTTDSIVEALTGKKPEQAPAPQEEVIPVDDEAEADAAEPGAKEPPEEEAFECSATECKLKQGMEDAIQAARHEGRQQVLECLATFQKAAYPGIPDTVAMETMLSIATDRRVWLAEELAKGRTPMVAVETTVPTKTQPVAVESHTHYQQPGSFAKALVG